jgi:hypothetical protein
VQALILLPERDCRTCTAVQQKAWGCTAKATMTLEIDGEVVERCPRRPLLDTPDFFSAAFWLYGNYDRGILPEGGTLKSNPHKLVQVFRVIQTAKDDALEERERRERRKAAAQNRLRQGVPP